MSNTFLSFRQTAVNDTDDNSINSIPETASRAASKVTVDGVAPVLRNFSLEMNTGFVRLTFSETVDQGSFSTNLLRLQSSSNVNAGQVSSIPIPTLGYTFPSLHVAQFQLTEALLNDIKVLQPRIGTSPSNTFLSSNKTYINDTSGNSIAFISNASAIIAGEVRLDNVKPELREFTLNMNEGTVLFSFTESINVDPTLFNLTGVVFSVNATGTTQHTLHKEESIISLSGPEIKIKLAAVDIQALTKERYLAKSEESTFISFGANFARDTSGLTAVEIPSNNGKRAKLFIKDETDPNIIGFDLDMDNGMIKLKFDEVMKHNSFKRQLLKLQNAIRNPTESFGLKPSN